MVGLVSISTTRRIRSCQNPSDLLVQIDGGIVLPIVDLIRRSTAAYLLKCRFPCETGRSQAPRRQQVTLAMSLFDLQDLCIAIGSLATLDLPMVVDLIGIYVLKGPYCTLTTTNWFLQALLVIPRGSWGDVARCFTMIQWGYTSQHYTNPSLHNFGRPSPPRRRPPNAGGSQPRAAVAVALFSRGRTCFDQHNEKNPIVPKSVRSSHHWSTHARPRATHHNTTQTLASIISAAPLLLAADRPMPAAASRGPPSPSPYFRVVGLVSISTTRRIRSCQNPSDLLVQIDGGIVLPVVDLIKRSTVAYLLKCRFPCETGRSQAPRRQQGNDSNILYMTGRGRREDMKEEDSSNSNMRVIETTDKIQMLCMRNMAIAEGYNHSREPKNSGIDQQLETDSAKIVATGPSNADPPPAKPTQATAQGPKHRKATAGSYKLNQLYSTSYNSAESSKQHKVESEHLPQKARTEPDAYANRLHKGDVFVHLTIFKQTSERNIQTKRLNKRSPTLPLLLQSELSTIGNRRR
ncbi:hypothetical protein F511_13194 [Dorcoceras hygrometricum]|uniref:Uncharacterized protein n=1 Tax=Dorcoceras hygrometricum TaxID=472368 RepID=A0A2Z7AIF9_9LAMI|nr:hypothetical protein F511_13194 [Dorcoceras hygrometricum]